MLVLSGGADLGGVALGQFVQASGVLKLELGLSAEEILQVLQQLQPGLRLLLQISKLLHQLVTDLCISKKGRPPSEQIVPLKDCAYTLGLASAFQTLLEVNI